MALRRKTKRQKAAEGKILPIPPELVHLFLDDEGVYKPGIWWWAFDTFIQGLIIECAKKFLAEGHGYFNGETEESFKAYLEDLIEVLETYDKYACKPTEGEDYERARAAMQGFFGRLSQWWD